MKLKARLYHTQAGPQRVVGNTWYISALKMPYKPIYVKCYTLVRQRSTEIQVRRLRRSHFLEELRQMGCDGWHHYCQHLHLTNEVEERFYGNHHMPYTNLRRWEPRVIEETPMTFRGLGGSILIHPHGNKWMASREVEKVSGGYLLR
ncbi:hypothetical protein BHE74_00016047 [Ensete ventricosum]|uniref:Uncharacterized protein n=1 Tax=Ensete ventricosum TaxID=4639 RepID=A0A445MAI1_ENSVE|nr:hypothetical protein BHE74_00016047 [Ensete ventricosum]RZR71246.1 hypothetical protein BHM03_00004232 [Ensete ventricosum]